MTPNQNLTDNASKAQDKPKDDPALKAAKPSDVERELSDEEIAKVAAGNLLPKHQTGSTWNPGG
jgi:hypothetical protein